MKAGNILFKHFTASWNLRYSASSNMYEQLWWGLQNNKTVFFKSTNSKPYLKILDLIPERVWYFCIWCYKQFFSVKMVFFILSFNREKLGSLLHLDTKHFTCLLTLPKTSLMKNNLKCMIQQYGDCISRYCRFMIK